MRKLFCLFFALLALCLPARAIELPDGLNGAVPDELLESAQEEGLMTRGAEQGARGGPEIRSAADR